jgi:hypothetical protein
MKDHRPARRLWDFVLTAKKSNLGIFSCAANCDHQGVVVDGPGGRFQNSSSHLNM